MPLKVTDTPPSIRGNGTVLADTVAGARSSPKMDTSEPGTTGAVKEAASTTPPGATTGVWHNAEILPPICFKIRQLCSSAHAALRLASPP
jgi:hypothetical protein